MENIHLIILGTIDINIANATAGANPLIKPKIIPGRSLIHAKNLIVSVRYLILEMHPMNPAGKAQKTTIAAMAP